MTPFFRPVLFALALSAATLGPGHSSEPPSAEDQFESLRKRFEEAKAQFFADHEQTKTNEERERLTTAYPAHTMVDDFLKLEAAHRGTQVGISALHQLCSQAGSIGGADSPAAKGRQQSLKILATHYADHPDLDVMFDWLSSGSKGPEDNPFLRRAAQSPHRHVRGTALFALAKSLTVEAQLVPSWQARLELVQSEPEKFADEIKLCEQVLSQWNGIDPATSRREAEKCLDQVIAQYGDVLEAPRTGYGPMLLKIERDANDKLASLKRRPLAQMAESTLFELTHLSVGQPVPEIAGPDAFGKALKLSDHRGKVTVVMFSFKGCGPCEAMYPDNRKLIKAYANRPFAILGVMGDSEPDTVRKSVAEKTITWPVWWDGTHGPVATQWNVSSWPTLYVLDHHGIIRYRGLRGEVLAKAVARLVADAEPPGFLARFSSRFSMGT